MSGALPLNSPYKRAFFNVPSPEKTKARDFQDASVGHYVARRQSRRRSDGSRACRKAWNVTGGAMLAVTSDHSFENALGDWRTVELREEQGAVVQLAGRKSSVLPLIHSLPGLPYWRGNLSWWVAAEWGKPVWRTWRNPKGLPSEFYLRKRTSRIRRQGDHCWRS